MHFTHFFRPSPNCYCNIYSPAFLIVVHRPSVSYWQFAFCEMPWMIRRGGGGVAGRRATYVYSSARALDGINIVFSFWVCVVRPNANFNAYLLVYFSAFYASSVLATAINLLIFHWYHFAHTQGASSRTEKIRQCIRTGKRFTLNHHSVYYVYVFFVEWIFGVAHCLPLSCWQTCYVRCLLLLFCCHAIFFACRIYP